MPVKCEVGEQKKKRKIKKKESRKEGQWMGGNYLDRWEGGRDEGPQNNE